MAVEIDWIDGGVGLILAFSGVVEGPDLIGTQSNLATEVDMTRMRYQVWDFTEVAEFNVSIERIREMGAISGRSMLRGKDKRFVAVAAPQDIIYGQMRQWSVFTGPDDGRMAVFEIFRDRQTADSWIDARMTETYGADSAPFGTSE